MYIDDGLMSTKCIEKNKWQCKMTTKNQLCSDAALTEENLENAKWFIH